MKNDTGAHAHPWRHRRKALVVAGDSQARRHLREALSRVGYMAEVSGDLRTIQGHPEGDGPSLLIVERGEAAIEVVRQLRRRGADIPVLLLSGGPATEERLVDSKVSFVEHLSTPFTLKTLRLAIAKVTQSQG